MKNIHIIPTEKPSRLYLEDVKFKLTEYDYPNVDYAQNQHIYITNDEKIKEGDYGLIGKEVGKIILTEDGYEFLIGKGVSYEYGDYHSLQKVCKKIILTTDQDLINDGVQAINDDFLEWFVKNPSCEFVEVEKECIYQGKCKKERCLNHPCNEKQYKIIIPQEEPKQSLSYEESVQHILTAHKIPKEYFGEKEDPIQEKDLAYWKENAEEDYMKVPISVLRYITELEERMYSEEDLREAFENGVGSGKYQEKYGDNARGSMSFEYFIEQLKNK